MSNKAVVVLSGGQDSVTCLAWALNTYTEVVAITFDYGQRHRVEIDCATHACSESDTEHKVLDVTALNKVAVSALFEETPSDVNAPHVLNADLPASYVPNRNATFLTLAHAYAQTIGAKFVVTGVCQSDYSGYPDCREGFIQTLNDALNAGAETDINIVTPLMHKTKAQIWELADDNNALEFVIDYSHTCYNGNHELLHKWGYGCGECPACKLRKAGYEEFEANIL